ncbi:beta-1,3-glucan recognition protein 1 [Ptiloglossa arizonensis]|uniref:beta-1,3-glucan recognition protein 1 n=1 Tax=Ptiloglossa arizonensis TaxID=3350558 RepID=UPI003F9F6F34
MNALSANWLILIFIFLTNAAQENLAQYVPPKPIVEPLYPKGLRMSIPHEDGISLVAYHVKFNEDFQGLEAGTIARDIVKTRNERWTYEDKSTRLKRGDVIYYWIHVIFNGLGYNLLDQHNVVNDFYNYDGTLASGTSHDDCKAPTETKVFFYDGDSHNLRRQNVCSGQLIFEEEFQTQLNTSRWTIVERFTDAPNYEFVVYMNTDENIEVKDGTLHIKPVLTDNKYGQGFVRNGSLSLNRCTGTIGTSKCKATARGSYILPPVISGRINTKPSFNFLYGNIEVRAKLPRGDWIYPLISLESIETRTENTTHYYDILIAHSVGNPILRMRDGEDIGGHVLLSGVHVTNLNQNLQQDNRMHLPTKTSSSLWSNEYHVYELEWRSGHISVKVDGVQYGEQNVPILYDKPVYLNVGLAVGGHILFPDMSISGSYEKPWRNVASKALYHFYLAEHNWLETWKQSDTGLHIDYIKVRAI